MGKEEKDTTLATKTSPPSPFTNTINPLSDQPNHPDHDHGHDPPPHYKNVDDVLSTRTSHSNPPTSPNLPSSPRATQPVQADSIQNRKIFFISQKGNTYRPYYFANKLPLITNIYDGNDGGSVGACAGDNTNTNVNANTNANANANANSDSQAKLLFTSTRFKKNSGSCVFRAEGSPSSASPDTNPAYNFPLEVTTTYKFGPGNHPIVSFPTDAILPTNGGSVHKEQTMINMEIKPKGKFTRTRYFELPLDTSAPARKTRHKGGRYEWSYVEPQPDSPVKADNSLMIKDGKGKCKGKAKEERERGGSHRAASRMVLEKIIQTPTPSRAEKGKEKEKDEKILIAEFHRADSKGEEITSGIIGPAGQGGHLEIFHPKMGDDKMWNFGADEKSKMNEGDEIEDVQDLPDWLVIVTCLVMLKRERDRRTIYMTAAVASAGGGGGD